ncbi:MAG: hypothetical protein H0X62_03930 [Bacteroidetes bacterium]|nr:hypothetical protein [Bacteroidota bacterium]
MINFSEGPMPHGKTILDLPEYTHTHGCRLGAHTVSAEVDMDKTPNEIESLFPADPAKKSNILILFSCFHGWK